MADDTAALLRHIGIEDADVFGYSMGGGVVLQVAIRHPEVVRKLVVALAAYNSDGIYPEVLAGIETITPKPLPEHRGKRPTLGLHEILKIGSR